jgi:spoIIIJ-associated protein
LEVVPGEGRQERAAVTAALSAKATKARDVVKELLDLMGFELAPRVVEDGEDEIHVDLVGTDEGRAIGKTGEVLLSLQFLANRIVAREVEGGQVVVLDAAGYRRRRREALEELARRLAAQAKREGRAIRLSPMSAHDRRVFHVTLSAVEGVSTRSQGEGLYRRMLIVPAVDG